jgi:predicted PurR-regulated permease PerM
MLGFDRRAASYTFTAVVVVVALCFVYLIRSTLFVFIVALLFAYLLSPLVDLFDRVLPGSRTPGNRARTPALALAYIILVGGFVLIIIQIGALAIGQAKEFSRTFPATLARLQQPNPEAPEAVNSLKSQAIGRVRQEIAKHSGDVLSALPEAGFKFLTVAKNAIFIVIIPILAFFFLKDGRAIAEHILDLVDQGPRRQLLNDLMDDIHLLLAHYMRALILLAFATFAAYAIFFSAMGVPYGVLLAAVAALFEFIPMLGPFTAGVIILVVAGVSAAHVLVILAFLLIYRLFQDYILSPHLMGQGVELHPLLVLFGVFAGGELAGIAGTFLSVPVLALVRVLYVRIRKNRLNARLAPKPIPTL